MLYAGRMSNLAAQVQTYLEIYDPLGMGELTPLAELYAPVVGEILALYQTAQTPDQMAEGVHRVLLLSYGTGAGHPRNYADLGKDLWKLVHS